MRKRENGSGSIVKRKRAHGAVYVAIAPARYGTDAEGALRCIRQQLGVYKTSAEARRILEQYNRTPTIKFNYTLAEIYADWSAVAFSGISKQTRGNYTAAWAKISTCPMLNATGKPMRDITTGELRDVLTYYRSGEEVAPLSKSYLTKIKALLTSLYSYAMEYNVVDRNYAALIKLTGMQDKPKRSFTDLEFAVLERNYSRVKGGDVVYALCFLGFRASELCRLTPFDYDPVAGTLRGGLKTDAGRDRLVPVHPAIRPIIDRWYARGCGTLLADERGRPYNKDSLHRRVWSPAIAALGLPDDLTPHSARHTCATRLAKGGARPEDIQAILGHSDYALTANVYVDQDLETLRNAMEKIACDATQPRRNEAKIPKNT